MAGVLLISAMHLLHSLLGILCLSACTHVAESPLRDKNGTPVVILIPGVPKGHAPRPVEVMAIDARLLAGTGQEQVLDRYLPESKNIGHPSVKLDGLTGEVQTFSGETFHAYFPILKVSAVSSPERVTEATNRMAADLYLRARRTCRVYPMTDLKVRH
jgi:hypothetical protein